MRALGSCSAAGCDVCAIAVCDRCGSLCFGLGQKVIMYFAAIVLIDLRLCGRGDGALHAATSNGDLVVMKTLLDAGADANHANEYVGVVLAEGGAVSHACCCRRGRGSPIHRAAEGGHLSCLEFLVAQGADVHAKDK